MLRHCCGGKLLTNDVAPSQGAEVALWRRNLLEQHTLCAVVQLPPFTFEPHASTDTHVIVVEKGRTPDSLPTTFIWLGDAGLKYGNKMVYERSEFSNKRAVNEAVGVVADIIAKKRKPDTAGRRRAPPPTLTEGRVTASAVVNAGCPDWSVAHHLPWIYPAESELLQSSERLIFSWAAACVKHTRVFTPHAHSQQSPRVVKFDKYFAKKVQPAVAFQETAEAGTVGSAYLCFKGHNYPEAERLPGNQLLVTASMYDNGISVVCKLDTLLVRCSKGTVVAVHS
jgi:hypothetical protein